ncbi:hypothetical protein QP175_14660 [Sphingomonas aerolata]|uniref:hypothetical protein n=1 Tax=Sphingomonas aerolata TaxID=185951 RepID=UPI002FE408A8
MNDIVNRLRHGGEFQLAAEPLRQMTVQGWALTIVLLAVAIGASSFRIILAPGFEMYLGPIFYLLAYRLGGLRLAIPMVLLTMASSWFWWGHIFTIALALGHVLFINWTRFAGSSLAIATAVFLLTIGTAAGFLFLRINYDASLTIFALTMIRKLLNDVLMAALVDLTLSLFVVNLPAGRDLAARNGQPRPTPASIHYTHRARVRARHVCQQCPALSGRIQILHGRNRASG